MLSKWDFHLLNPDRPRPFGLAGARSIEGGLLSRAVTTHHSLTPNRVTSHVSATPLGHGRGRDRYGRLTQRSDTGGAWQGEAGDRERVLVGCGAPGSGSPDAATGRDWKGCWEPSGARVLGEPHGSRKPRRAAGNRAGFERGESTWEWVAGGTTAGICRGASRPGLCFFPHATFVARTFVFP